MQLLSSPIYSTINTEQSLRCVGPLKNREAPQCNDRSLSSQEEKYCTGFVTPSGAGKGGAGAWFHVVINTLVELFRVVNKMHRATGKRSSGLTESVRGLANNFGLRPMRKQT